MSADRKKVVKKIAAAGTAHRKGGPVSAKRHEVVDDFDYINYFEDTAKYYEDITIRERAYWLDDEPGLFDWLEVLEAAERGKNIFPLGDKLRPLVPAGDKKMVEVWLSKIGRGGDKEPDLAPLYAVLLPLVPASVTRHLKDFLERHLIKKRGQPATPSYELSSAEYRAEAIIDRVRSLMKPRKKPAPPVYFHGRLLYRDDPPVGREAIFTEVAKRFNTNVESVRNLYERRNGAANRRSKRRQG